MKLFNIMLCTLFAFASFSANAADVTVHSLSLRVLVGGKVIMAPNLQMFPDVPAYVSYTDEGQTEPTYSLQITLSPDIEVAGKSGTAIEAVLWGGAFKQTSPVVNTAILLDPTAKEPQSLKLITKGQEYEIQVVSHAVFIKDSLALPAKQATCLTADGKINSLAKSPSLVSPQDGSRGCCGGPCRDGTPGSMMCCGAIACCVCGICCQTP
jgi:hypothetical protein